MSYSFSDFTEASAPAVLSLLSVEHQVNYMYMYMYIYMYTYTVAYQ